jgi:hypothetical protein
VLHRIVYIIHKKVNFDVIWSGTSIVPVSYKRFEKPTLLVLITQKLVSNRFSQSFHENETLKERI